MQATRTKNKKISAAVLSALAFVGASMASGVSHAGIVDNMLQNRVPYMDWRTTDPYLIGVELRQNPGYWHHENLGGGFLRDTWVGDNPADGEGPPVEPSLDGSKIPPYSPSNFWYQRSVTGNGFPTYQSYLSFFPSYEYTYDSNKASAAGMAISKTNDAGVLGVTVGGFVAKTKNDWMYRYTISNTSDSAKSIEFILSEFFDHAGIHHEFNFLNDGGSFNYDGQPFGAVSQHNYDWTGITLAAGTSVQVGFSDIHAPAFATWGLRTSDGVYSSSDLELLPVPSVPVPESSSLMLGLAGLATLAGRRSFARRQRA